MSEVIIDASIVLAWLFADEKDPRAERALVQLEKVVGLVPWFWHLETRNALLSAERRGRISASTANEHLGALKGLPIQTDEAPNLGVAFELARVHNLSFYDAMYLELAIRRQGTLATLDAQLARAALKEGLEVPYT